jgi:hypothetical protein
MYNDLKILYTSFHKETYDSEINRYIRITIEYELAGKRYKFTKNFGEFHKMSLIHSRNRYSFSYEKMLEMRQEIDKIYRKACIQHYEENVVFKYWRDL